MFERSRVPGAPILLSPSQALVVGGAAEALERQLQDLLKNGYRNLVVDLSNVPAIDSAGLRGLVRGNSTARRMHASLRLAAATPAVKEVLDRMNLGGVFDLHNSIETARVVAWPWKPIL